MVRSVEVLTPTGAVAKMGAAVLEASVRALESLGIEARVTQRYRGDADWLCTYGVGEPSRNEARHAQIKRGGRAILWDIGYINPDGSGKELATSYMRVSVDENHPWRCCDATPEDPSRWNRLGVSLREDARQDGPVIVIGMGAKSRVHLGLRNDQWELYYLQKLKARFPTRRVLYRAKPGRTEQLDANISWPRAPSGPIEDAIRGASLVVCRHSNVALDACIAGVPVECEDGIAYWLYRKGAEPNPAERLSLLRRTAWWQWRLNEMREAWTFLQMICGQPK